MTLNLIKLGSAVTFIKYLASVISLIFLRKTLIWNKINFAELLGHYLMKSISKKCTHVPFSIQYIAAHCKDFKGL